MYVAGRSLSWLFFQPGSLLPVSCENHAEGIDPRGRLQEQIVNNQWVLEKCEVLFIGVLSLIVLKNASGVERILWNIGQEYKKTRLLLSGGAFVFSGDNTQLEVILVQCIGIDDNSPVPIVTVDSAA